MSPGRLTYSQSVWLCFFLLFSTAKLWSQIPQSLFLIRDGNPKELHGSFSDSLGVFNELARICSDKHFDGYLEAGVDSVQMNKDGYTAFLHIGPKYTWISIQRNDTLIKGRSGLTRLMQRPVSLSTLNRIQEAMLAQLTDNGYPGASLRLDSIRLDPKNERETGVSARLAVDYGTFYRIDSLRVRGEVNLKPVVIKHLLGITPGMPYSRRRLRRVEEKLNRLPFLQTVGGVKLFVQDSSVYAEVPVKPRRANSFAGILGLMPVNDQTGELLLTGDIQLRVHNLLGYAEYAELSWQRLQVATQQLKVRLNWPYLFGTALGVNAETDFFRIDTSFYQLRLGVGFAYRLQGLDEVGFFLRQRLAQTIRQEGQVGLPSFPEANTTLYGIMGRLNRLDHPVNPRRGIRLDARFALGRKTLTNDSILNADSISPTSMEWQADLIFQRFQPIGKRMTFLTGFQGGWMENPYLFVNDLYRIGGINTLRGFDEEALYVSRFAVATMEWRFLLDEFSWISLFADGGYIERAARPAPFRTPVYSMGTGLTFDTPAGLFSIMYAVGATQTQSLSFDRSKIHFGYSARF